MREAIIKAFEHSRNGNPTQVVCIDDHFNIETVWTYGVDLARQLNVLDKLDAVVRSAKEVGEHRLRRSSGAWRSSATHCARDLEFLS